MTPVPGALPAPPPVEARLAAAGLPSLTRTAWLEIDLGAVADNLGALRRLAGPGVRIEPVVKADAYGHGAVPVTLALEAAGADGCSVAALEEALELREGGVTLPVLVLYPVPADGLAEAARLGIAVTAGAGEALDALVAAAPAAARAAGAPVAVHLEVETGLGRGGVLPSAVAAALARLGAAEGVRVAGLWTHLADAADPVSSRAQDARFGPAAGLLEAAGLDAAAHLAASGGLIGGAVARRDAVRAGLATWGLVPDGLVPPAGRAAAAAAALRPAMSLVARPVRVADLPAGHGVGYGGTFVTDRPSRIATLPLGYGDGWHRILSGRASALVRGVRVPLVGRVSMDSVTADVTDVPGPPVTTHDEVVLLGAQGDAVIGAGELASAAGTITYEVVTAMSRRLPRVYHAAGSVTGLRTLPHGGSGWHPAPVRGIADR